ncbi:hypothetical protein [Clostridium paraputrificum]|uniref:hypothetical protein n=1 Tax=Clostridium paraputrificum TaxID=29363 RepID=UPI00374F2CB4
MEILTNIFDIYKALMQLDYMAISIIIFVVIFLWLYKQLYKFQYERKIRDSEFIDSTIDAYSQLLIKTNKFLNNKISDKTLINAFLYSSKYLDTYILNKIFEYKKNNNISIIEEIEEIICDKIKSLKKSQLYGAIQKDFDFTFDSIKDSLRKNNIDILINPLILTFIILFFILNFFILIILPTLSNNVSRTQYLNYIFFSCNIIIWLFLLTFWIDILFKKTLTKNLIIKFFIFISIPFICMFLIKILPYDLFIIAVFFIINLFFIYSTSKIFYY